MYLNIAVLFISKARYTVLYTGKSISVINSKHFGLKCLCAFLGDCNEDNSVNILKFANITHYVELIYTYLLQHTFICIL